MRMTKLGTSVATINNVQVPVENVCYAPRFSPETGWYGILSVRLKSAEDLDKYAQINDSRKVVFNKNTASYVPYTRKRIAVCYNTNKLIDTEDSKVELLIDSNKSVHFGIVDTVVNVQVGRKEDTYTDYMAAKANLTEVHLKKLEERNGFNSDYVSYNCPYKLKEYGKRLTKTAQAFNNLKNAKINRTLVKSNVEVLAELLGDFSIGFELETSKTKAYPPKCVHYGLIPLQDGSLPYQGKEFASFPIQGATQLQTVFEGIKYLQTNSEVNLACALHVHFGNIPKTKEFYVALYMIYQRLQEEIFSMLPHYLRNPVEAGIKSKNYASALPKLKLIEDRNVSVVDQISPAFARIYDCFIGTEVPFESFDKTKEAPWNRSWNSASRYSQLNMVGTLLDPENGTVEFRGHPPTLNAQKVYLWTAILAAIMHYTKNNTMRILSSIIRREKILLQDVIDYLLVNSDTKYVNLHSILSEYINYSVDLRLEQEIDAITNGNSGGGLGQRYRIYRNQMNEEIRRDSQYFDLEYEI